jgi:tetratricopeptide (TPR) repeat protein
MEVRILPALAALALWGPMKARHALALCEGVLEEAAGDRRAEALTLRAIAHLEAMLGRFDQARERYRRSRATLEELGWTFQAALTSINSGAVEVLAGDLAAAETELRTDFMTLERMGERNFISTTAGFLADVLYQLGRYADAQELSSLSEEVAAPDDVSSQALWRCVRAKVMAREGRFDEAAALARDGVSIIGRSDDPNSQGNALMDLAEVLRLAGKGHEALAAAKRAAELFAQKGNVISAGRAQALLGELTGPGLSTPLGDTWAGTGG